MSKVQSLLFDKQFFNKNSAIDWCIEHGFKFNKIDITDKQFRFRQLDPQLLEREGYTFRTITVTTGLKFILAYPIF